MRLLRTVQVLAMTKSREPDESGNYKNLEIVLTIIMNFVFHLFR